MKKDEEALRLPPPSPNDVREDLTEERLMDLAALLPITLTIKGVPYC